MKIGMIEHLLIFTIYSYFSQLPLTKVFFGTKKFKYLNFYVSRLQRLIVLKSKNFQFCI